MPNKLPEKNIPIGYFQILPGQMIESGDIQWCGLAGKWKQTSYQGHILTEKSGLLILRSKGMPSRSTSLNVISETIGPVFSDLLLEQTRDITNENVDDELIWEIASACYKWANRIKK